MTEHDHACCGPSREDLTGRGGRDWRRGQRPRRASEGALGSANDGATDGMVRLAGTVFQMGSEDRDGFPQDREGPIRDVALAPYWIDPVAVTNARFAEFVEATGHVTQAEREGWSFVFGGLLPEDFPPTRAIANAQWWRQVFEADWRRPEGPGRASRAASTIPSSTSPGKTPTPTAPGPACACRTRPSGSTPPAAAWSAPASPGAMSSSPAAATG